MLENQRTPLHWACINGRLEVAMALIEKGAAIDARDSDQYTPLYWAFRSGHLEVAMALIEVGADVYARDIDDKTPRCTQAMTDLFNRLWRSTPLLTAMHSNDMDTFQTLLNDDTYDVNEDVSTNGDGWTILHKAASLNLNVNRMEYVALLLQSCHVAM